MPISTKSTAAYAAGSTTVNLTGTVALAAGDAFMTGVTHTITAPVTPSGGVLTGVTFTPATTLPIANGATVNISRVTDYQVRADVAGYPAKLIDGATITVKDLRVVMAPVTTDGATLPPPTPAADSIIIDGAKRTVGVVNTKYIGSMIEWWDCQAKG